jgi:hypothetical protein
MDRLELNEIIDREHEYPIHVSPITYPEVEEMYMKSYYDIGHGLEKSQIGSFYQKHDYQGVRNALEIINHFSEFKDEVVTGVVEGKGTRVAPSQLEYLEMIGWNVKKLNLVPEFAWASRKYH